MRQFILPPEYGGESRIELTGDEFKYLCLVLRLKAGSRVPAMDAAGNRYVLEIERVMKGSCSAALRPIKEADPAAGEASRLPRIVLFQGLPKGKKIDLIIRQACESGVSEIVPMDCDFSVARSGDSVSAAAKRNRWERIAREAGQQSGSSAMTAIATPVAADLAAAAWKSGDGSGNSRALFFHQVPLARSSLHSYLIGNPVAVAVAVGPEGGFSEREVGIFRDAGFVPIYLGASVLRTETAALFAVAAVSVILLEKNSWTTT
jgi:16S rRNA (uracil1498-N3)-methyltransferase